MEGPPRPFAAGPSSDIVQPAEIRCGLRVPPPAGNNHTVRKYALVSDHVFADHIDIVEFALANGQDGRVADTAWLQGSKLGPFQGYGGISGGRRDDVGERHSHAEKLRKRGHLVERGAVDAKGVDVRGDRVRIEAVGEHAARGLECK